MLGSKEKTRCSPAISSSLISFHLEIFFFFLSSENVTNTVKKTLEIIRRQSAIVKERERKMSRFSRKWLYIYFSFLCSHRRSALISLYIICQSCVTLYRWSIYRGGCVFPVEKANNDARGRRKMLVEREWGKNFIPMGYLRNFLPLVQKGLPVVCVCTESS